MELLKLLDAGQVAAHIISFLLLFFLLRKFFWQHVLRLLDRRREKILSELENIEKEKSRIAELESGYNQKIEGLKEETKRQLDYTRYEAQKITEEIRKKAHLEAQEIVERARSDIKYELLKAREELKGDIIELTAQATEYIIKEKLTEENDKKLIGDFLEGIDKLE
ncbi:MAG: F0F1 ATP synthase subunit B [Candidatus Omnitrophota bacterium]